MVRAGWTFIELLIVLSIFGTLTGLSLPYLSDAIDAARVARAIGDIDALQTEITSFQTTADQLPVTLRDIGYEDLTDPWGTPYFFTNFYVATGGKYDCGGGGDDDDGDEGNGNGKGKKNGGGNGGGGGGCQGGGIGGVARKDRFLVPLNTTYDLFSAGKDGGWSKPINSRQSRDDVIRAMDGSYIGLASRF